MKKMNSVILLLLILVFLIFVTGCQFNYDESMMAEDLADEIPETILKNFSQVMVKDSLPAFYIQASESRSYGKLKETVFTGVRFQEYDDNGNVITDGRADNAKMFNETESVELWGNLNFYSEREEASLEGEYLFWDNENSTLSGKEDDRISIVEKNGSEIAGKGFFRRQQNKIHQIQQSGFGNLEK